MIYSFFILVLNTTPSVSQNHPSLTLTESAVLDIRENLDNYPLFAKVLTLTKEDVDLEIQEGIDVPIPKDMAGGYTHERHKKNFFILQKAGNLYQITGEKKYAIYVRDMFLAYAEMYPTLPIHPTDRSYSTGKIFWQCLNDANWLVYAAQAYDCIYNFLSKEEISLLEKDLFRPMADFLSIENPKFFNRIHNHSTWGNAAVGMIGLAMGDEDLVKRALYGLTEDDVKDNAVDNDGGFIKTPGVQERGFLAQLDYSFSPDGYFTEGPYYLRYAIFPFLVFGKALINNRPDLDLMNYRDGILTKAVYALLNQTDPNGLFFPINDSQKGMSWNARELVTAVDVLYFYNRDPELLSIAEKQGVVLLDEGGYAVAKGISEGLSQDFQQKPIVFVDGPDGDKGGVGILRSKNTDHTCLVMKYSAQGMGHGHFDKLSYSMYDLSGEVVQDYGAARWVNIDQKGGGRYLPENKTYAKQTIAHNTLVVNETSHFLGKVKKGEAHQPEHYYSDVSQENIQVISAKDFHAYPGVVMHRTMILMESVHFRNPLIIDVMKVESSSENQYDLPLWYMGHPLSWSTPYNSSLETLAPLGDSYGYQHIWKEGSAMLDKGSEQFTWFGNSRFYTMTTATEPDDEIIFARSGANDPNFNLRHDPVLIHRRNDSNTLYASVIESHGRYNPVSETPHSPFSGIESIEIIYDNKDYTAIDIKHNSGDSWEIAFANVDNNPSSSHSLAIDGRKLKWQGVMSINEKLKK